MWAGSWIDPSVPLSGPKEHPTMSVEESYTKWSDAIRKNNEFKKMRRQLWDAQGESL